MTKVRTLPVLVFALFVSLALAATAEAAPSARVIPVWAGVKHDKRVENAVVVARTVQGKRLTPPGRVARNGVANLLSPKPLPRNFVVEVRQGGRRGKGTVLRATVRDWQRARVVYVDPFSTMVSAYSVLHPGYSAAKATMRVQRHLGIGPETRHPEGATFWSERAFSGRHFARAAAKHHGIVAFSARIAHEVDRSRKPHRFPPPHRKKKGKHPQKGQGGDKGKAGARISTEVPGQSIALTAERLQSQEELIDAAKAVAATATGSPSAIVQLGELLDTLLGGGDTGVLKQIASQLETLEVGMANLEQQVGALDGEVAAGTYSGLVTHYLPTQKKIETAWSSYVHSVAAAGVSEGAGLKEAEEKREEEAKELRTLLKGWEQSIPSALAVPVDNGSYGLMAWAQNALAKQQLGGTMTATTQEFSRSAAFTWWAFWWKDLVLHTEKWNDAETRGEISKGRVAEETHESAVGLERAAEDEYGETLPESLVYSITPGMLYSVGTVWNVKPNLAPPAAGQSPWKLATLAEANALPAHSTGLMEAMQAAMPGYPYNPNKSMEGVLGIQPNNGKSATSGGYGEPPETEFIEEPTHMLALAENNGGCEGRWSWIENGQGDSNLTGAPIIELCPALDLENQTTVPTVCAQVMQPGVFYGWAEGFPLQDWNGIWRHEKAIEFKTCNDVDEWQHGENDYPGLTWGTGVFAGGAPLSEAIIISNSPSAYYALWARPIEPKDDFLVGPVTNSG